MKAQSLVHMYEFTVKPAMDKYHKLYNNYAYKRATNDKGSPYANALIDEALALCGHPHYKLSFRNWSVDALAFLQLFIREEGMQ